MRVIIKSNETTTATREARAESIDSETSTIDTTQFKDAKLPKFCLIPHKDTTTGNIVMSQRFDLSSIDDDDETRHQALNKIVVLDDANSPTVSKLLQKHEGKLMSIPTGILTGLRDAAPVNAFPGRVADFNDNLFYDMQDESLDVQQIIENKNPEDDDDDDLQHDIREFQETLCDTLQDEHISYRGSFMETERTIFQPAHVDYDWPVLQQNQQLYLAFFPLTEEGAFIQLWADENENDKNYGTVVFIPYGNMLIVPSRTIHGGGFKRGPGGNLRFHLYIAVGDESELPKHQVNKYTEEKDRSKELCDRFVDSPGLDSLLGTFFE